LPKLGKGYLSRVNHSEPYLISSEASHVFVNIQQKLCTNVPKEAPQQLECVNKEKFKIK